MIELWQHQQESVDKIAPLGSGALLHDMGVGKSRAALALVERWDCRRVLILCPKSVVPVWPKEFAKCGLTNYRLLELGEGTVPSRARLLEATWMPSLKDTRDRLAVVLNYDAATYAPLGDTPVKGDAKRKWAPGLLRQLQWDCIICDEAHMLKDPFGKQSGLVSRLASKIPHRLGLTGTPMPHDPSDIFAQYRIVDPRIFGWSFKDFQDRYVEIEERYVWRTGSNGARFKQPYPKVVGYKNLDELHAKVYSVAHRVMADDVLDLPPTMDVERYCTLDKPAAKAYAEERGQFTRMVKGKEITDENALVMGLRQSQITSGFLPGSEDSIGTEKSDMLAEFFGEIAADEPVVVFCRFTRDVARICAVASECGRTSCELTGQCNDLAVWQAGEYNVLAVQVQAGGVGVDFTRARYCVWYSQDFDSGAWQQARKRIHRPGQTRPVLYVNLLAKGTIDEVVLKALKEKRDVAKAIIDDMHVV
jgi:SNF2 family DNA or RNA helicase